MHELLWNKEIRKGHKYNEWLPQLRPVFKGIRSKFVYINQQ